MTKTINLNGKTIQYELTYKKVKNINLRIKPDGTVFVSASKRVAQKIIDDFLISKADFIRNALKKYQSRENKPRIKYLDESETEQAILNLCNRIYPVFEKRNVKFPQIKFRKMKSRWGSCNPGKGILTFNTQLMYAPPECIEYVVVHEFAHFFQPNHSALFYNEVAAVLPDWKDRRKKLRDIGIYPTKIERDI